MAASYFYAVETESGVFLRGFQRLSNARKWARRCKPARIVKCSIGGLREVVQ